MSDFVLGIFVVPVVFENLLWGLLCGCDTEIFQCLGKYKITMELIQNENLKKKKNCCFDPWDSQDSNKQKDKVSLPVY